MQQYSSPAPQLVQCDHSRRHGRSNWSSNNANPSSQLSSNHGSFGLSKAVLFAKEIGLLDMIFEGDFAEVIQAIIQENSDHPDFGHIIDDIRILASDLNSFQFCHVKRNCNVVADALAKRAKNSLSLDVWLEEVPDDIVHLLSFDVP